MTSPDQERWSEVKEKLRAEVGEDIFQSWFARMDLERIEANTAHLSVPTRFLKSWIQSHYTDRVLACWQGENADDPEDRGQRAQRRDPHRAAQGQAAGDRPSRIATRGSAGSTSANCAPPMRRSPPGTTRSAARRSICG